MNVTTLTFNVNFNVDIYNITKLSEEGVSVRPFLRGGDEDGDGIMIMDGNVFEGSGEKTSVMNTAITIDAFEDEGDGIMDVFEGSGERSSIMNPTITIDAFEDEDVLNSDSTNFTLFLNGTDAVEIGWLI